MVKMKYTENEIQHMIRCVSACIWHCSDSKIDKPQRGRPKRAELSGLNINTGVQSINTERAYLKLYIYLCYCYSENHDCFQRRPGET